MAEDCKPVREILGMVDARRACDLEVGAEKCRAQLGDELFHRMGVFTETFPELTVTASLMADIMSELMEKGRVVGFRW